MLSHDAMRIIVKPNMETNRKFLCAQSASAIIRHTNITGVTNPQLLLLSHPKHIRSVIRGAGLLVYGTAAGEGLAEAQLSRVIFNLSAGIHFRRHLGSLRLLLLISGNSLPRLRREDGAEVGTRGKLNGSSGGHIIYHSLSSARNGYTQECGILIGLARLICAGFGDRTEPGGQRPT